MLREEPHKRIRPLIEAHRWRVPSAVFIVLLLAAGADAADRRPNILIIMPDQMRGQAMGVAGDTNVRTPTLDRLARDGLFLPNTFANTPVCCPARASILTGLYTHRHGVLSNDLRLRESSRTLAEVLADAGYATGFIGKWHLDGGRRMPGFIPPGPRRQGFQFWAANECNHNHFNSSYFRDTDQPIPIKRFEPEVWTDEAIGFIRANRDRPFFLFWTCGPPHDPKGAPPDFEKLYDPAKLVMRPNWKEGIRGAGRNEMMKYYAAITAIDAQVGRMLDVLKELGIADDTIVLFTSDHGDMVGSQGVNHKCKPWEESIRVPGIIRYPSRIAHGRRGDTLFSHVDFMPTLLSLCGVSIPPGLQGRDLSKSLTGRDGEEPECVLLQMCDSFGRDGSPAPWRAVRTKGHLYARFEDKPWLLCDIEKDPYQLKNLVDEPATADLRARLDALLRREMERVGDSWSVNLREHKGYATDPAIYHPSDRKAN